MSYLISIFKKLIYAATLLCFVILVITGFGPKLITGGKLTGFPTMIHVTVAIVFVVCMTISAVLWAESYCFNKKDWPWLCRLFASDDESSCKCETKSRLVSKLCFWAIVILTLPVTLSIVLSMFPIFGSHGQEFMMSLHYYSAIAFVIVAIIHTGLLIIRGR